MNIEFTDEQIEEIVVESLKDSYHITSNILKETLSDEEFTAVHSFDFDEEVFYLVDRLESYEKVISEYGGYIENPVMKFLKETNNQIYATRKEMSEIISQNKSLINQNNILKEELEELKHKIKNILG